MDAASGVCLDDQESISYVGTSRSDRNRTGCKDGRKGGEKERRL